MGEFFRSSFYIKIILPISLLSGTIIGAGVFSLPYIFSTSGWLPTLLYLVIFSLVFYFVHIMYADIILRSGERYKFVGYAKNYLGELAFWMSILVTVIGSILTLTAYLILSNKFLQVIFPTIPFLSHDISLFWIISSIIIFIGVKRVAKIEFFILAAMILITFFIFLFGLFGDPLMNIERASMNPALLFLPFGPILFSLSGRTAIPSVIDYFEENQIPFTHFKKVIFIGTMIPVALYVLFILGILGVSQFVTVDSIETIASLPFVFPAIVGVLGILSLLSSYIVIGLSIDEILHFDLKIPKILSGLIVVLGPLALPFIGFNDFIKVISLAGGIFLALEGIIVISMWRRTESLNTHPFLFANSMGIPRFLSVGLMLIFFVGILYTAVF